MFEVPDNFAWLDELEMIREEKRKARDEYLDELGDIQYKEKQEALYEEEVC